MRFERLTSTRPLPAVVRPETSTDLLALARADRDAIRRATVQHGALLFRGFDVRTPADFGAVCAALSDELLDYTERSTPRSQVEGKVYTSTEYRAVAHIPLHCEMAYARRWPRLVWMYSHLVAEEGGETPICDARQVHDALPEDLRARFRDRGGVMYVRNFRKKFDLSLQEVYGVSTDEDLEAYCAAHDISIERLPNGVVRTRAIAQSVVAHPETGELAWFNQAHLFHVSAQDPALQRVLLAKFKEEGLPRNAYYGDGSALEPETLLAIRDAYARAEVVFPWERGDVLMIDNMLVSHGRRPFVGARTTLVAMAETYPTEVTRTC